MSLPLIVTAAIIRKENRILLTRRAEGKRDAGKWEFPGGKLNPDESPEEGLHRELMEELNLPVAVDDIFKVVHHRYEWGTVLLLFYECRPLHDEIENREVAEHRFIPVAELTDYDILEADRPVVQALTNLPK